METEVKQIIAPFIGISTEEISGNTPLDRNALKSSIRLHRMYAKLASGGYAIKDYSKIENFASLMNQLGNGSLNNSENVVMPIQAKTIMSGVGIDIVEITEMPQAQDFRTNEFYTDNFTATEISYCILQSNPYASFAGLSAAKEAIVKANNSLLFIPFSKIFIDHDENGKPQFSNFDISISHSEKTVVAIAILIPPAAIDENKNIIESPLLQTSGNKMALILSLLSIIIAVSSILIAFKLKTF